MKPVLTRRAVQWTLLFLFCTSLAYGAQELTQLKHPSKAQLIAVNQPLSNQLIPYDSPSQPEPLNPVQLSNRLVEYHIAVELHPDTHTLQAAQVMTWQNPGTKSVQDVYLHLYPNAFESDHTTFNVESGGQLRNDKMTNQSYGRMKIESIETVSGENLSANTSYVQPDDGNDNDHTLMKVHLNQLVTPGEKVSLNVKFSVVLPFVYARMGYADDFYMVGQWFPKFAVYEPAGARGNAAEGWDLHQYHGNSEFYADFGLYDVSIQVPKNDIVAATGFPVKPAVVDGDTKTYHFYADDVHDFAWAASPNFIYSEQSFSAPNLPGVKIKLYLDPKHQDLKNRYLLAAKKALSSYTQWYGTYPYSTLSIVVPPGNANGAGGMEYPTLITAWGAADNNADLNLERVIVHEVGHQFWYGMIASNEFEEAWLDEGFTSYAEDKVMQEDYGVQSNLPLEASYITSPASLTKNAWDYGSNDIYAENVYLRAKLVLNTIEKTVGSKLMEQTLQTYFQKWQFRHPATADFQAVLEQVTGQSWQPFFNDFIYNGNMLDYSVDRIKVTKTQQQGRMIYNSQVTIRKHGALYPSVPIQFHFADGTSLQKTWDSQGSEIVYTIEHATPVEWVSIDPQHTLLLENIHMNNFLKTTIDPQTAIRWNMSFDKLIETLFAWVSW